MRLVYRVIIRVIILFVIRVKRVIYSCTPGLSPWISPSPGSESRPVRLPALRCVAPSCLDRPDVETQAREYARRPLSGLRGQPGAGLVRVDFRVSRERRQSESLSRVVIGHHIPHRNRRRCRIAVTGPRCSLSRVFASTSRTLIPARALGLMEYPYPRAAAGRRCRYPGFVV